MKTKFAVSVLVVLILVGVLLPSYLCSIDFGVALNASTPIKKACLAYSALSYDDTTFLANNFDLVVLNPEFISMIPNYAIAIRTKNPSATVLAYRGLYTMYTASNDWAEVNQHEDWFLHDINGNRIQSSVHYWYLMDPGNTEWRRHFVLNLNSSVLNGYDGLFADDVWNTLRIYNYTVDASNVKSEDVARWHDDVLGMIQYVKANIGSKLLVINTDQTGTYDYVSAADGIMIEPFAHASWDVSGSYYSSKSLFQQIDDSFKVSGMDKIVCTVSGVSNTVTSDLVKYCYVMNLLGINGLRSYWCFNDWKSSDGSHGFYSIMNTNVGLPVSSYYISQNTYMRDFTLGKVISNPSENAVTVFLGNIYWFLNNTPAFVFTLPPYSGEILLNAPVPSPTVSPSPTPSRTTTPTTTLTPIPTITPMPTLTPIPTITPMPTLTPIPTPTPTATPSFASPSVMPSSSISPTFSSSENPKSSAIPDYQIALIVILPLSVLVSLVAIKRKKIPWIRART